MPLDENSDNARLSATDDSGPDVVFDFNPAAIVISHSVPMQSSPGRAMRNGKSGAESGPTAMVSPEGMASARGITTIVVRSVTFVGPDVKDTCERLHDWTAFQDASGQSPNVQVLPKLNFTWGPQSYPVNLNQVTINYTRFDRTGQPVRAVVDITLHLIPQKLTATNPSSGGLPGRRSHLLTGAETLAGLSTRTYGGPDRWREIATANGIQDPLRVRPGTLVYLPSTEETGR
jgi:hypothetical protein